MNNKIIGLIAIALINNGILAYAFIVEGAPGGFFIFLSLPSFVFVIGVGGGLTFMRKHTIKDENLGKSLRSDLILAGWLGFLIGYVHNSKCGTHPFWHQDKNRCSNLIFFFSWFYNK